TSCLSDWSSDVCSSDLVRRRNLARSRSLAAIFEGANAVVDLAGLADDQAAWRDVWKNNLAATMNSLEAARRAGVHRYVFASSNRSEERRVGKEGGRRAW